MFTLCSTSACSCYVQLKNGLNLIALVLPPVKSNIYTVKQRRIQNGDPRAHVLLLGSEALIYRYYFGEINDQPLIICKIIIFSIGGP